MKIKQSALSLALMAVLVGCGGGGGGGKPAGNPPNGGGAGGGATLTGRFIGAPVAGLKYTVEPSQLPCEATAAGCVTDENGTFEYKAGDLVTFMLGEQTLGTVQGQGVVTPQTVAEAIVADNPGANVETVRNNLLVFLQSLDDDGNPENGINIAPEVSSAITARNSVSFTAEPAVFDDAFATMVESVEAASGKDLTIVDREDAVDHFIGQLAAQLRGTFVGADADFAPVLKHMRTLTFFGDGTYLYGGHDGEGCDGMPGNANGIEIGSFGYDPQAKSLIFTKERDTNDCGGPENEEGQYWQVDFDGARLTITLVDASGEEVLDDEGQPDIAHFVRVPNGNGTVAGAWLLPHTALNGMPTVFTAFPGPNPASGRYFLADARRDSSIEGYEGLDPGIEEGCYTVDSNNVATFTANAADCDAAIDTNGEDGFNGVSLSMTVDSHGRLTLVEEDYTVHFMPVPSSPYSLRDFAGAWILEADPGVELANQQGLFVLVLDAEDGGFVFGTQHNIDPAELEEECAPAGYPTTLGTVADGANGIESGVFQQIRDTGRIRSMIEEASGIDTNGWCGMFDAEKENSYIFRKSLEPDTLTWWDDYPGEEEGYVFRRVVSEEGSEIGLWRHGTTDAPQNEYTLFLPGGQVFSIRFESREDSGIRRERYSRDGDSITVTGAGFDRCVDTIDDGAACEDTAGWTLALNAARTETSLAGGTMFKVSK